MANPTKQYPKDGLVIISMLKELGITNHEPRVVNQLLEFATRYVSCVLDDARAFANHSKKKTIDLDDIKLAVGMQMEKVFTTPPPRDLLLEVARSKNSIPLPIVKPHCGIRLPPDRHCFSACNYRLKSNTKKGPEKIKYSLSSSTGGLSQINSNINSEPPLKMAKTSSSISAGLNNVNSTGMPVVKRTVNTNNVARSQAITAVAKQLVTKPIIKLATNSPMNNSQSQQQTQQQLVQAKARIQVTSSAAGNTSSIGSGSNIVSIGQQQQQQQQSQQGQQMQQPSPQSEVKIEPNDSTPTSASSVLSSGDHLLSIKRKREDDFGGLENNWRRLVIAVPQSSSTSSSSTIKVCRTKTSAWHSPNM